MRARLRSLPAVALVVLVVASTLPSVAHAAQEPPYHPSRLAHIGEAKQVIVVTAPDWSATRGTLRAYERGSDGQWQEALSSTGAWLGSRGMVPAASRRQSTNTTPAGTFAIPSAFGRRADPGTGLPYVQVDRNDSWPYDRDHPRTYNVFQDQPVDRAAYGRSIEWLWSKGPQYDYVAVLDYNLPEGALRRGADGIIRTARPANTSAGGGIFLHVSKGEPTAGCISVPRSRMRALLQWLDPAKKPVIVIGPQRAITRM